MVYLQSAPGRAVSPELKREEKESAICKLESCRLTIVRLDLVDIGELELAVENCLEHFLVIPDFKECIGVTLGKLDLLAQTDDYGLLTVLAIYEKESIDRDLFSDDLGPESALLIVERYELHLVGLDAVLDGLLYFFVELFKHNNLHSPDRLSGNNLIPYV